MSEASIVPAAETAPTLGADGTPVVTPMQMLQMAVEQGADLDKLSKLMDLQERWEASEARKAFIAAKAAFKAEAPQIDKNKQVGFDARNGGSRTEYRHATLDHIEELLSPILSKHELTYSWETAQHDGGQIEVTCILTHVLGHSERVSLRAGPDQTGNKNNIQAVGSTVTFLSRYTLLLVTGLTTGDMDDDGERGGAESTISDEQKDQLVALMKETNADTAKFLNYMNVSSLDELPASRFNQAIQALEAKRAKA